MDMNVTKHEKGLKQTSSLPRAPPDVRGKNPPKKTKTIPHRCEGGVLCCINRPPQRPCLKHAIFFALLQQKGRSTPAVAAQTTVQMPKHSCHCLHALIAYTPMVSGQAHGFTYVAKMGKRLHSAETQGGCIKVCLITILNVG